MKSAAGVHGRDRGAREGTKAKMLHISYWLVSDLSARWSIKRNLVKGNFFPNTLAASSESLGCSRAAKDGVTSFFPRSIKERARSMQTQSSVNYVVRYFHKPNRYIQLLNAECIQLVYRGVFSFSYQHEVACCIPSFGCLHDGFPG